MKARIYNSRMVVKKIHQDLIEPIGSFLGIERLTGELDNRVFIEEPPPPSSKFFGP